MTNHETARDLLNRAESYLSALHGSVARHDQLAANLACAGCELRDQITAELGRDDAVSVPPPAPRADDRAAVLREAADAVDNPALASAANKIDAAFMTARTVMATKLRRLADEAQQPETLCGRTTSVTRTEYPPCARSAGHPEAYCRSADGKQHFLALYGPRPAAVSGPCVAGEQQNETPEAEVVHGCPPDGSGLTPCCGRTPFELPLGDRISSEAPVTCTPAVVAQPGEET